MPHILVSLLNSILGWDFDADDVLLVTKKGSPSVGYASICPPAGDLWAQSLIQSSLVDVLLSSYIEQCQAGSENSPIGSKLALCLCQLVSITGPIFGSSQSAREEYFEKLCAGALAICDWQGREHSAGASLLLCRMFSNIMIVHHLNVLLSLTSPMPLLHAAGYLTVNLFQRNQEDWVLDGLGIMLDCWALIAKFTLNRHKRNMALVSTVKELCGSLFDQFLRCLVSKSSSQYENGEEVQLEAASQRMAAVAVIGRVNSLQSVNIVTGVINDYTIQLSSSSADFDTIEDQRLLSVLVKLLGALVSHPREVAVDDGKETVKGVGSPSLGTRSLRGSGSPALLSRSFISPASSNRSLCVDSPLGGSPMLSTRSLFSQRRGSFSNLLPRGPGASPRTSLASLASPRGSSTSMSPRASPRAHSLNRSLSAFDAEIEDDDEGNLEEMPWRARLPLGFRRLMKTMTLDTEGSNHPVFAAFRAVIGYANWLGSIQERILAENHQEAFRGVCGHSCKSVIWFLCVWCDCYLMPSPDEARKAFMTENYMLHVETDEAATVLDVTLKILTLNLATWFRLGQGGDTLSLYCEKLLVVLGSTRNKRRGLAYSEQWRNLVYRVPSLASPPAPWCPYKSYIEDQSLLLRTIIACACRVSAEEECPGMAISTETLLTSLSVPVQHALNGSLECSQMRLALALIRGIASSKGGRTFRAVWGGLSTRVLPALVEAIGKGLLPCAVTIASVRVFADVSAFLLPHMNNAEASEFCQRVSGLFEAFVAYCGTQRISDEEKATNLEYLTYILTNLVRPSSSFAAISDGCQHHTRIKCATENMHRLIPLVGPSTLEYLRVSRNYLGLVYTLVRKSENLLTNEECCAFAELHKDPARSCILECVTYAASHSDLISSNRALLIIQILSQMTLMSKSVGLGWHLSEGEVNTFFRALMQLVLFTNIPREQLDHIADSLLPLILISYRSFSNYADGIIEQYQNYGPDVAQKLAEGLNLAART